MTYKHQAMQLSIISRSVKYWFFFGFLQLNFLIGKLLFETLEGAKLADKTLKDTNK